MTIDITSLKLCEAIRQGFSSPSQESLTILKAMTTEQIAADEYKLACPEQNCGRLCVAQITTTLWVDTEKSSGTCQK